MSAILVKTIVSHDSQFRLCIYQSTSGAFFFEEEWFRDYSNDKAVEDITDVPAGVGAWQGDGRSGYYASVAEAEEAAKLTCGWPIDS